MHLKRKSTPKSRAANRLNGRGSHGPAAPKGKARLAVSRLVHSYCSKSGDQALEAQGEKPADFNARLDSLLDAYQPANALEVGLVVQMARAMWRMNRFHRIAESMAVKHLERAQQRKILGQAIMTMPLIQKMERLEALFAQTCCDESLYVGPEAVRLFEACRADLPAEKAPEVLRLLARLREPGTRLELGPLGCLLEGDEPLPAAEGEERHAAWRELAGALADEIQPLKDRICGENQDEAQAQFDRDQCLAGVQPEATLMNRGEESSLRQLWRTTNLLLRVQKTARDKEMLENDERSRNVVENKG
jgi:hypothetical protein